MAIKIIIESIPQNEYNYFFKCRLREKQIFPYFIRLFLNLKIIILSSCY